MNGVDFLFDGFALLPSYCICYVYFQAEVINYKGDLNTPPDQVIILHSFNSNQNKNSTKFQTRRRERRRLTLWGRRCGWGRARKERRGMNPVMRMTGDFFLPAEYYSRGSLAILEHVLRLYHQ